MQGLIQHVQPFLKGVQTEDKKEVQPYVPIYGKPKLTKKAIFLNIK